METRFTGFGMKGDNLRPATDDRRLVIRIVISEKNMGLAPTFSSPEALHTLTFVAKTPGTRNQQPGTNN
jgi:hypothetical protein